MNDFKTLVHFRTHDHKQYEGNIRMFAGENMIQDDEIVNIHLSNKQITFYIPAKETSFKGSFNDSFNVWVERLESEIDTSLTLEAFYGLATKLTDYVHCSHTGIRLPVAYQNLAHKFGNYFPFRLFFTNRHT